MDAFCQALEKDPAEDLLSVVGMRYISAHRVNRFTSLSEASRLNFKPVYCVQDQVHSRPEINLRNAFPADYDRQYR